MLKLSAQPFVRRRDEKVPNGSAPMQDAEEIKEESLTRLKAAHSGSAQYKVQDGDFQHFPEITPQTI